MDKINDYLEKLSRIQQVDAPPFMLTAIEEKIHRTKTEWITPNKLRAFAAAFVLLLLINAFAILHIHSSSKNEKNIAQVFQLMPDNNLYE